MTQSRLDRERELEELAAGIARDRLSETIKRSGLSETAGGKALVGRLFAAKTFSVALAGWVAKEADKLKKSGAYDVLVALPLDATTLIVYRTLVDSISKEQLTYHALVKNLSEQLRIALGAHLYESRDSEGFKRLTRRLNWSPRTYTRQKLLEETLTIEHIDVTLTEHQRLAIGTILIELFCDHTGLFETHTQFKEGRSIKHVRLTDDGQKWGMDAMRSNQLAYPFHLPMVVPPYPWTDMHDGGYLLQHLHPSQFVRVAKVSPKLAAANLDVPMSAVNAIQATPWRIHQRVYAIWKECVGRGLAGTSNTERVEVPDSFYDWGGGLCGALMKTKEAQVRQGERREVYDYINTNTSLKFAEAQKARLAEILLHDEKIYYVHNLDSRGRVYPTSGAGSINPQGDDGGRALIEFAEGMALGEEGVAYLFVHAQNCWGNDKGSLQDRIDATQANLSLYLTFAADPMLYRGWMKADKPFQFLQVCFDLQGYDLLGREYICHTPMALDGTCSGLQHYAALTGDQHLAEAVNVLPHPDGTRQDIYMATAEAATAALHDSEDPLSVYWLTKVTRALCKLPVMCKTYGVTANGMRNQVQDYARKQVRRGHIEYQAGTTGAHAAFMSNCIDESISTITGAADAVMSWLKASARQKAQDTTDLDTISEWTSPMGLPVRQDYFEYNTRRFKVVYDSKPIQFTERQGPAGVQRKEQQLGIAPNFIHSLDASHLCFTTNALSELGVKSFAMIHDSFAVPMGQAGILFEVCRDEFFKMYQTDWLLEFYLELPEDVQVEIGPPPSRGSLDLSGVLNSEFFFS